MLGIDWLDGGTLTVILGALGSIAGALAGFVKWCHGFIGRQVGHLVAWAKPLIEGAVTDHRELITTLKDKQVETTEHIGAIRGRVDSIDRTLMDHSHKLKRIEDHTCPSGPAL